jgi:hypothetical protein
MRKLKYLLFLMSILHSLNAHVNPYDTLKIISVKFQRGRNNGTI